MSSIPAAGGARTDAGDLELFSHRFGAVARAMGERLRRTSLSTNVKERLDFSCGVLDPEGSLVVNAPHIPVHLGALGLCVRRLAASTFGDRGLAAGDTVVTNHPGFGGSHLPDVTLVTPVHEHEDGGSLLGYVASRAHHAELGGTRPGSMPPHARTLAEEGVVIAPFLLRTAAGPRWLEIERILSEGPWPSRSVGENLADLRAALAANLEGAATLRALAARHGAARTTERMRALRRHAAERMQAALERFGDFDGEAVERLDDGWPIAARVAIRSGRALLDLTASGDVHPGNLNAPEAVVRSAVLYVLRLVLGEPLPLNEGLLDPVELRLRPGLLAPPFDGGPADRQPAVVGGNVETSQRLVDALLRAFGLAAASQGTMNNLLFGDRRFAYYETVAGGCGATPGHAGADAVHSHMTNTRITDPEVLEARYPVRLDRFAIRRGSGGRGRWRGGDGVVREMTFLAPLAVSLLTQHRVEEPFGMAGGAPGARGRQRLVRASGEEVELAGITAIEVAAGDRLILETPGGGAWGEVASEGTGEAASEATGEAAD
jgi:5-oxoprolinase (ATP-hydrolysing)